MEDTPPSSWAPRQLHPPIVRVTLKSLSHQEAKAGQEVMVAL